VNQVTVVCICWLKLQELDYNAPTGKRKVLAGNKNVMLYIEVVIMKWCLWLFCS